MPVPSKSSIRMSRRQSRQEKPVREESNWLSLINQSANRPSPMAQKRVANPSVYWDDEQGGYCVIYDIEAGEEHVPGFVAWTTMQECLTRPLRAKRLREAKAEAAAVLKVRHKAFVAFDDRA